MTWTRAQIDWPTAKVVTDNDKTTIRPRYKDKHGNVHLTNHVKTLRHDDQDLETALRKCSESRAKQPTKLFDETLSWANETLEYYQLPRYRKPFLAKRENGVIIWQYMSYEDGIAFLRSKPKGCYSHGDDPIQVLENAGLYWSEPWHAATIAKLAYLAKLRVKQGDLTQSIFCAMDLQEAQDDYYFWSQTTAAVCATLRQVQHGGNTRKTPVKEVMAAVDDYLSDNPRHNITAAYAHAAEQLGYSTSHVSRLYKQNKVIA